MDSFDVKEWINYAQEDYESAAAMAKAVNNPYSPRQVCYHCQQSAEKILKAYTIAKGNTLTKTHDLEVLINECMQYSPDFDNLMDFCEPLTPYASITRYPPLINVTKQDMIQALEYTGEILKFTKSKLAEMGFDV